MPRTLSEDEIQDFRAELCRVAERQFGEQGYSGVTLRGLAAELGCSPMTPYRYFENKEAIFVAVRTAAFVRFGEIMDKIAADIADPIERLRAFFRAYLDFAMSEPHAYRIMFTLSANNQLDAKVLSNEATRADVVRGWDPLVDLFETLAGMGLLEEDPLTAAHLGWTVLHGLASLALSNKLMLGRSFDELIEPSLNLCLRGLGAPPTSIEVGAIT